MGHKAVTDVVNHFDYHATLFHLFGLDLKDVNYARPNAVANLMAGQPGKIVNGLLKNPV